MDLVDVAERKHAIHAKARAFNVLTRRNALDGANQDAAVALLIK